MEHWICSTCGVEYPPADQPPERCPICEDARQWVPPTGQQWTTLAALQAKHRNSWLSEDRGLFSIKTEPTFGIGQEAFLLQTGGGNILWDCISLIDDATIAILKSLGGVTSMAISHPHYYSTMIEWSKALGGVPIWIHEAEREWVQRRDGNVLYWSGETKELQPGCTLVRCGGHFEGYQILHWEERRAIFAGDQPQVTPDRKWVTFLWSYPNMVPLGAEPVRGIVKTLEPLQYDRIYGAFGRHVLKGARDVVQRSAERYLQFLGA